MNNNTATGQGGEFSFGGAFEGLNERSSKFDLITIQGQEYEDFKKREISTLRRITPKGTKISEEFLFMEFTFTKPHTERLLREFGKYQGKSAEVVYIDGHTTKGVLQITEPDPFFDDITKLGNQIVVEGQYTRNYISYARIMKEGVYIRVIDDLDGLKENVSRKINDTLH